MPAETVFEFLLEQYEHPREPPPNRITVTRSRTSKYQFYLVVRHYRQRLNRKPEFYQYTRAEANALRSELEEYGTNLLKTGSFLVLEGFPRTFTKSLELPGNDYLVAETDDGELQTTHFGASRSRRRDLLKILQTQLGIRINLTQLKATDWSSLNSDEEFEIILRQAKLMEWTEEELRKNLQSQEEFGQLLLLTKMSKFDKIEEMREKHGATTLHYRLIDLLGNVIHYRALKILGYEEDRIKTELRLPVYRMTDVMATHEALSRDDLDGMVQRAIELDELLQRNKSLGLDLFLLNAPIRMKK